MMTDAAYRENYKLIDWSGFIPRDRSRKVDVARSDLACPMIQSDNVEIVSPLDGQTYTSNSRYEQHVKDHGCIITGRDPSLTRRKPKQKPDIAAARAAVDKVLAKNGI